MTNVKTAPANTTSLWAAVLGLTAALGSYGLACVFPFAAIAALAAVTLPTRQAAILLGATWLVNQTIGFALLGYPHDAQAVAWGLIIGAGAFGGLAAARAVTAREAHLLSPRTIVALVAAIVAYQVVMFGGAIIMDGFESSTPAIVADVVRNDLLWFAGLAVMRLLLSAALPRWFGSAQTLRTA